MKDSFEDSEDCGVALDIEDALLDDRIAERGKNPFEGDGLRGTGSPLAGLLCSCESIISPRTAVFNNNS